MVTRIAIIDMGTNTFHLLVAEISEKGYCIIHREKLAVKLGMGGINRGFITEGGIQRSMLALQSFKNVIDQLQAQKIYAFGTSALRNARNADEVVHKAKELTGIDVNIISGDQEAEFIYLGAKSAMDLSEGVSMVMDIGGGSVEFIICNNDQIFWKESFEIGAQRLLEKFQHHDPISSEEVNALREHLKNELGSLMNAMQTYKPSVLIGSSGTFDTLSDIFCHQHNIHKSPEEVETPLTIEGFHEIFDVLKKKNREERMLIPGMIEMRVDMIVVACCLIQHIFETHFFNRIRVSTYSLKEGVLTWLGKSVPVVCTEK